MKPGDGSPDHLFQPQESTARSTDACVRPRWIVSPVRHQTIWVKSQSLFPLKLAQLAPREAAKRRAVAQACALLRTVADERLARPEPDHLRRRDRRVARRLAVRRLCAAKAVETRAAAQDVVLELRAEAKMAARDEFLQRQLEKYRRRQKEMG